ncbi:MAG TPA: hypothetical protein VM123_12820 [archaeon]|nr:hypothetical protein [archaeon]
MAQEGIIYQRHAIKNHKLACGMNGIHIQQGVLGDSQSPNNHLTPQREVKLFPKKPPSLPGGSSFSLNENHLRGSIREADRGCVFSIFMLRCSSQAGMRVGDFFTGADTSREKVFKERRNMFSSPSLHS